MVLPDSPSAEAAPTHMSLPAVGAKKAVDNGTGYVAPTFEKKEQQMETGKPS